MAVVGHEAGAGLVSVAEFRSSCAPLLKDLEAELEDVNVFGDADADADADLEVKDLRLVTDADLIEGAVNDTLPPVNGELAVGFNMVSQVDRTKNSRRRTKRGRPRDAELRAHQLQLDDGTQTVISELIEERNLCKRNAEMTLQSLKAMNEGPAPEPAPSGFNFESSMLEVRTLPDQEQVEELSREEVLLAVDYYNPSNVKVQGFLVLGSQRLSDLRDQLYCLTDVLATSAGTKTASGYFYIENVFYDDMRDPEATEYSQPLTTWAEELELISSLETNGRRRRRRKLQTMQTAKMEETCFQDLNFKIGSRYLYCHQGGCKHSFVVREVRMIHVDDKKNRAAYPLLTFLPRLRYRRCSICNIHRAAKVTYGDKLAPTNPCFFCNDCYELLHCSSEGRLLYDDFMSASYVHE